jgi:hypothetical protein
VIDVRARMLPEHAHRGIVRWLLLPYPRRQAIESTLAAAEETIASIDEGHRMAIFDALILNKRELIREKHLWRVRSLRRGEARSPAIGRAWREARLEIDRQLSHIDEWIVQMGRH